MLTDFVIARPDIFPFMNTLFAVFSANHRIGYHVFCGFSDSFIWIIFGEFDAKVLIRHERNCSYTGRYSTVSYTHLDVYKRQSVGKM